MRVVTTLLVVLMTALAGCTGSDPGDGGNGGNDAGSADACATDTTRPENATNASNPVWCLDTTMGTMRLTLFLDKTPITSGNIINLTEDGYFDGIKFHRVIANFMNQAGDPKTKDDSLKSQWGTGGPGYSIQDEFYCADGTVDYTMDNPQYAGRPARQDRPLHQACNGEFGLAHDEAGVLSMANSGPNSGGSQFFITATATPHLDGAHPVFGKVADQDSLDVVLAINQVQTDASDRPLTPIVIEQSTIEWS